MTTNTSEFLLVLNFTTFPAVDVNPQTLTHLRRMSTTHNNTTVQTQNVNVTRSAESDWNPVTLLQRKAKKGCVSYNGIM